MWIVNFAPLTPDADHRNETLVFPVTVATSKIYVWIYDHKTLGKDKELASGEVDVLSHLERLP